MKFQKKHCVAMLLAGGQGSRLLALTRNTAKPAVPFGGKYRIIDFPLSNCVNSGIDTVGILTQYQPLELNEYIGNGQPWNLNKAHGGVQILPPYARSKNSEWYKGTANAVYQNFSFIDRYDPEHILVLSGDHIYTMRYDEMLLEHERKKADCTIAVRQVPMDQASRFGILNLGPDGAITEFAEKPEHPKSDLASMGIYIFRWEVLRKALEDDEKLRGSSHDFGKDVIPRLLKEGRRMFAYRFGGYWKDVGTIESLWQANMDLLGPAPQFVLRDGRTTLYARNDACPGSFLAKTAKISDSLIAEGCEIAGRVQESVVSTGCRIEEGAVVERSVLMPNVTVRAGAKISHAIVAEECTVCTGAAIGQRPQEGQQAQITVIGKGMELPAQSCVCAGEMVERG